MNQQNTKTCGQLWSEVYRDYVTNEEQMRIFSAGFTLGQAEKVYLGACPACMSRPSNKEFDWKLKQTKDIADRYGLSVTVCPSGQDETANEIWVHRPDYDGVGQWLSHYVNTPAWHVLRAQACGIPDMEVDYEFHKRTGYNKAHDTVQSELEKVS